MIFYIIHEIIWSNSSSLETWSHRDLSQGSKKAEEQLEYFFAEIL